MPMRYAEIFFYYLFIYLFFFFYFIFLFYLFIYFFFFFSFVKNESHWKFFDSFLIFAQNIDCGYTLEPPHRGGSNKFLDKKLEKKVYV